jgi:hypothetical protein
MRKLWLAVAFGVMLGLATTMIPNLTSPVARPSALMSTMGAQRTLEVSPLGPSPLEGGLIGLLMGLVVAFPVLVLARRRI